MGISALAQQKELPDWDEKRIPMFELKYSFSHFVGDIQENSHAIDYDVEIYYGNGIGEYYGSVIAQEKTCIGHAHLRLLRWERAIRLGDAGYNNGFGAHHGIETVLFKDYIYTNELKPEWAEKLKDCPNKNILVIKELTLDEAYRGHGWGRIIIKQMLHSFDDLCCIAMLSPCTPTYMFYNEKGLTLIPYFQSIGFTLITEYDNQWWGDIPIMFLNMNKPNAKLDEIEVYTICDY